MTPAPEREITVANPVIGPEAEALVLEVLRGGRLVQGRMVERFEELCCLMAGTTDAVAMSNGTVTLESIMEAQQIGPGDEVITSPFTFAATVNATLRAGATVRFADVHPDFTMDAASAAALVTPRTRAIVPVHLFGLMADMVAIEEVATRHGLVVIEDAAQAHGARQGELRAGGTGIGSFSFYATKNVTSGEGGVVTTSDPVLARHLRLLRNQGMERPYEYEIVGTNRRLTDLQAALAIPQLEQLDELIQRRVTNASVLTEHLADHGDLGLPRAPQGRRHVWHQYTVLLPPDTARDAVVASMRSRGVAPGVYYPKLAWDHNAYRRDPCVIVDETPVAADAAARCLSLPVHARLQAVEVERVASCLLEALDEQHARHVA